MGRRLERNLVVPNQVRYNMLGQLVIPPFREEKPVVEQNIGEVVKVRPPEGMPECAFINTEGLILIRNRINEKKATFVGSDEELAKKLVVFMGMRTMIQLDPHEETRRGYQVRLNIGIIAWETPAMDKQDIPVNHGFYQLLGVYREYNATGKPSTDKAIRGYATIQKTNKNHPENLCLGECFFAKLKDAVKVVKSPSNEERTHYQWKKK